MKRSALVLFAISFVCTSSMGKDQKGPDPALANIHKVFVKGNSEAAVRVRMVLNRVEKVARTKAGALSWYPMLPMQMVFLKLRNGRNRVIQTMFFLVSTPITSLAH